MSMALCEWCGVEPATESNGECKSCSRLPGHEFARIDERDDRIAELEAVLKRFVDHEWGDDIYIEHDNGMGFPESRKCRLCEQHQLIELRQPYQHADDCPYILGRKLLALEPDA